MKLLYSFKTSFTAVALPLVCSLVFSSCGGGGGGDSDGDGTPDTTRPKTLDGTTIALTGGVSFSFIRNTGTSPALTSGQTETGSFTYTPGPVNTQILPNISNGFSDVAFPTSLSNRTYTYQAVNESGGVITLNGIATYPFVLTGVPFNQGNGSFSHYFHSDSFTPLTTLPVTNPTVQMDITFDNNGGATISVSSVVLSIVNSATPNFDSTRPAPSTIQLTGGGAVPFNFNPTIDPNRPSAITPESLSGLFVIFTNGVSVADNFSVSFVADSTFDPNSNQNIDELGDGIQRTGPNSALTTTASDTIRYTWRRIPGTDNATLVISQGGNTFDGAYELQFTSQSGGVYIGTVDDGTPDAAQVSGTFILN